MTDWSDELGALRLVFRSAQYDFEECALKFEALTLKPWRYV